MSKRYVVEVSNGSGGGFWSALGTTLGVLAFIAMLPVFFFLCTFAHAIFLHLMGG